MDSARAKFSLRYHRPMDSQAAADRLRRELERLLNAEVSYLESSRIVSRLRLDLGAEEDPDLIVFVAIGSQTDHLPVGSQQTILVCRSAVEKGSRNAFCRTVGKIRRRTSGSQASNGSAVRTCRHGAWN